MSRFWVSLALIFLLGCSSTSKNDTSAETGGASGANPAGGGSQSGGSSGNGGSSGTPTGGASGAPGGSGGEAASDAGTGGQSGAGACSGKPGPSMVKLTSAGGVPYCVDSSEVTQADYQLFLGSAPSTDGQSLACSFNVDFVPPSTNGCNFDPVNQAKRPVACVDWCDAAAYCAWAGKRLCGRFTGGPLTLTELGDATASQWYRACSAGGTQAYPYGNSYVSGACADYSSGLASDVKAHPDCEGGYPGLFDMSGNVFEWVDSCVSDVDANDFCPPMGGSFLNSDAFLACNSYAGGSTPRSTQDKVIGFRCCANQ